MTIKEYGEIEEKFKNDTLGKVIGYGQCWDLIQTYFVKYLGLPESILGGCGLVSNMLYPPKINDLLEYFIEVPETQMLKGDIVIWNIGHIACFDSFDGASCWYVTQNTGTAENPSGCTYLGKLNLGEAHAFRLKNILPDEQKEDPKENEYIVKEGDTLWDICVRFYGDGTKYAEVATKNGITNPDLIYPGQVIKL